MTREVTLTAPLAGTVGPVTDVPDPVFAQGIMGPGLAIQPPGGIVEVRAPIDGRVVALKPHALVVSPAGVPAKVGVLVHLGIDTVGLQGEGFAVHVALNDEVAAGDRLVTWDTAVAGARGLSTLCPIVVFSVADDALERLAPDGAEVAAGDELAAVRL